MRTTIGVIVASTRQGRIGERVARCMSYTQSAHGLAQVAGTKVRHGLRAGDRVVDLEIIRNRAAMARWS